MIRIEPDGADLDRTHQSARRAIPMWTVYRRPSDYPEHYVARMYVAAPTLSATQFAIVADTLEELRPALPAGLVRLERQPADHPTVVEVWI